MSKCFLDTQQIQKNNKLINWNSFKNENFCSSKDTDKGEKTLPTHWVKIGAHHRSHERLVYRIYKEHSKPKIK